MKGGKKVVRIAGNDYYTTKELEQIFKVSRTTIQNWRKSKRLDETFIGGKVYFKKESVLKLIK